MKDILVGIDMAGIDDPVHISDPNLGKIAQLIHINMDPAANIFRGFPKFGNNGGIIHSRVQGSHKITVSQGILIIGTFGTGK